MPFKVARREVLLPFKFFVIFVPGGSNPHEVGLDGF
jgi:hypothetical protein